MKDGFEPGTLMTEQQSRAPLPIYSCPNAISGEVLGGPARLLAQTGIAQSHQELLPSRASGVSEHDLGGPLEGPFGNQARGVRRRPEKLR